MSDVATPSAVDRNTDLWVTFTQAIVDDPAILEDVPEGATVVLIPEDDPELAEINYQRAIDAARRGADVYIRHMTRTSLSE